MWPRVSSPTCLKIGHVHKSPCLPGADRSSRCQLWLGLLLPLPWNHHTGRSSSTWQENRTKPWVPPLDTFLSSSWLWEGLVLSCQEEPSSHKQQIKPRPVQHRQTVHSFACAQLSAHLLEEAATPAGTRSPTQGCCLKSSPLVAQAHHLCFPAMSLGSGNQVNPVLLPSMLLGSGPSEDSWTHLTDL